MSTSNRQVENHSASGSQQSVSACARRRESRARHALARIGTRASHFGAYRNACGARRRVAERTRRTRDASMAKPGSLSGLFARCVARARAPLSPRGRLKRIVTPRRLSSTLLLLFALTPIAFFLGLGTHPVIGWNLYVIGDVTNGNRAVKIARILGGCIPLDSTSDYHKQRCDAAIAPGKPLNRLGWSVLHVVNDIFFPGTIAWEYLHKRHAVFDFEILCDDIVRRRGGSLSPLPPPDAVVIHLRLGDDIEWQWRHTDLWDGEDHRKVKNKAYFEAAIEKFPADVKTVVVVGSAVHRNYFSDSKGSEWYKSKVVEFFTRRGYKVVQRLSAALPDDDFVYVANSRYFLPTGGGYGGQASSCVERLGGTSINVPGGAGLVIEKLSAESKTAR